MLSTVQSYIWLITKHKNNLVNYIKIIVYFIDLKGGKTNKQSLTLIAVGTRCTERQPDSQPWLTTRRWMENGITAGSDAEVSWAHVAPALISAGPPLRIQRKLLRTENGSCHLVLQGDKLTWTACTVWPTANVVYQRTMAALYNKLYIFFFQLSVQHQTERVLRQEAVNLLPSMGTILIQKMFLE